MFLPHSADEVMCPQSSRQLAPRDLLFDHGLPSGIGYLRFVSFCQPQVVAVSTEVDRVRLADVVHQNSCNMIELEAIFLTLLIAHVRDPEGLAPPR